MHRFMSCRPFSGVFELAAAQLLALGLGKLPERSAGQKVHTMTVMKLAGGSSAVCCTGSARAVRGTEGGGFPAWNSLRKAKPPLPMIEATRGAGLRHCCRPLRGYKASQQHIIEHGQYA